MTLGERIHELRKAAGISQEQLAEGLEVSRQSISKWERDQSAPELDKLAALSELFHVSLDQLVKGQVREDTVAKEVNIDELAKQNWYHRKMTILVLIGAFSIMLGVTLSTLLNAINGFAAEVEYILYRYITVNEWPDIDIFRTSYLLPAILFGIGGIVLTLCLVVRRSYWNRNRRTKRDRT